MKQRSPLLQAKLRKRNRCKRQAGGRASCTMKGSGWFHQLQMFSTRHKSNHLSVRRRPNRSSCHCSFCGGGSCSEHRRALACSLGWRPQKHHQRLQCEGRYTPCSPSPRCRERHARPALVSHNSSSLGGLVQAGGPICIRRG